jgi:hypothetical protein
LRKKEAVLAGIGTDACDIVVEISRKANTFATRPAKNGTGARESTVSANETKGDVNICT